jgi:hypothetical protein
VVDSERQVGSADSTDPPVRLGRERLLLIVGRGGDNELVSVAEASAWPWESKHNTT